MAPHASFFMIVGAILTEFFMTFPERRHFTKTYKNQWIFNDFASQASLFGSQKRLKNHVFSDTVFSHIFSHNLIEFIEK